MGLGIVVMYVVSLIDYRRLEIVTTPFYVCALLGLVGVYFVGSDGARRPALVQHRHLADTAE